MEANLQKEVNKLSVIQKAHIYEPEISAVAELSFQLGIKEVVEFVNQHKSDTSGYILISIGNPEWQSKLKVWGIKQ